MDFDRIERLAGRAGVNFGGMRVALIRAMEGDGDEREYSAAAETISLKITELSKIINDSFSDSLNFEKIMVAVNASSLRIHYNSALESMGYPVFDKRVFISQHRTLLCMIENPENNYQVLMFRRKHSKREDYRFRALSRKIDRTEPEIRNWGFADRMAGVAFENRSYHYP